MYLDGDLIDTVGNLNLNATTNCVVNGRLQLRQRSFMQSKSLILNSKSRLVVVVTDRSPPGNSTISFLVARYAKLVGRFSQISVSVSIPSTRDTVASTCSYGNGQPNYGSSSLSVTVAVSCTNSTEGLSDGAIAGIAVGAVVGGVLLAIAIILIIKHATAKTTAKMRKSIAIKEAENVKQLKEL